jgi:hypothetical protein
MKKLLFLPIIITILFACGISSCNKNDAMLSMDSTNINKVAYLTKGSNSPTCQISLNLKFVDKENGNIAEAINKSLAKELFEYDNLELKTAVDSFASNYIHNYTTNILSIYKQDNDTTVNALYNYSYVVNSEIESGRNGCMIYVATTHSYEGGAHGTVLTRVINYDIHTGKKITEDDIFVKGHEKELNDMLRNALEDKVGAKNLKELKDKGYLLTNDIYMPDNFYLYSGKIVFVYNPYEIAPYALGKIELTLSNGEMKKILK